jgi:hydroxymethylpyrimidine pyrophosphatase-like HAD family hydrolase
MASETLTAQDRARRIKVLLYDVDGVLTNGDITIIPTTMAMLSRSRASPRTMAWASRSRGSRD